MVPQATSTEHHMQPVETYLSAEHDSLDAILEDVAYMVEEGEWERAEYIFTDYLESLEHMLRLEEDVVLPLVQARVGKVQGIDRLQSDHLVWREAVDIMADGLAARSASRFGSGLRIVPALVPDHHQFEEQAIFPLLDHLLSDAERANFARQMGAA
jgi:hypothetical protein